MEEWEVTLVADDDEDTTPYELTAAQWRAQPLEDDMAQLGRLLVWYVYDDVAEREIRATVRLQQLAQISKATLGGVVWDAAVVLGKYLEARPELVRGARVLELGSGSGALGCVCAALGARAVVMTDYGCPPLLQLMRDNAALNSAPGCELHVAQLAWGCAADLAALPVAAPDLVVGSDLVYDDAHAAPLLETLRGLPPGARVLLAHRDRERSGLRAVQALLAAAAGAGFDVRPVPHDALHPQYRHPEIHVAEFVRVSAS